VSDHPRPALPDCALTAYARGGASAIAPMVMLGLVEPGEYECPACEGSGYNQDPSAYALDCRRCLGVAVIDLLPCGVFGLPSWVDGAP
jgi:hypothetical protein